MCFSAEASLSAAVVASLIGYLTIKSVRIKQHFPLACLAFLFSIQQFSEGMIWLSYRYEITDQLTLDFFKGLFLIFAFIVWPLYFPFTVYYAEQKPFQKKILGAFTLLGIILSSYFVYYGLNNTVTVKVINYSIQYSIGRPFLINEWAITGLYTLVILAPCFISSIQLLWSYGLLLTAVWLISEHFYYDNFTSVWCFFSAILSTYLYLIIRANEKIEQPEEVRSKTNQWD